VISAFTLNCSTVELGIHSDIMGAAVIVDVERTTSRSTDLISAWPAQNSLPFDSQDYASGIGSRLLYIATGVLAP
jgi:hypothetical protein